MMSLTNTSTEDLVLSLKVGPAVEGLIGWSGGLRGLDDPDRRQLYLGRHEGRDLATG